MQKRAFGLASEKRQKASKRPRLNSMRCAAINVNGCLCFSFLLYFFLRFSRHANGWISCLTYSHMLAELIWFLCSLLCLNDIRLDSRCAFITSLSNEINSILDHYCYIVHTQTCILCVSMSYFFIKYTTTLYNNWYYNKSRKLLTFPSQTSKFFNEQCCHHFINSTWY